MLLFHFAGWGVLHHTLHTHKHIFLTLQFQIAKNYYNTNLLTYKAQIKKKQTTNPEISLITAVIYILLMAIDNDNGRAADNNYKAWA